MSDDATGNAVFDTNGAVTDGWVEIYNDQPIPAAEFVAKSGISGVNFSQSTGALWHTEIYLTDNGAPGVHGDVIVEGVDLDGHVTGIPTAVMGPLATFNWR